MAKFYSRKVMTPEAIKKLIEIWEDCIEENFAHLFGAFDLDQEFIKNIKNKYPKLQEYNDSIFLEEHPFRIIKIGELVQLLEDWAYDILLDGNIELSIDFSIETLAEFISENDMAFKEFEEFFIEEGSCGCWLDNIYGIKKRFDEYLVIK